ncbi:MAG: preprotein translocase subunit SecE [Lachnospiraceae bacterium]|nr:preprotein translocase subunit SecE [Lachnospiraceae bacterium]
MADTQNKRTIADWWDDVKAEFDKIVWPTQQTIYRQTVATVVVSVITAFIIVFVDMLIQHGVDLLVGL